MRDQAVISCYATPMFQVEEWLCYAWEWIKEHDPNGFLEMLGSRCLASLVDGVHWYHANARSDAVPNSFRQETTIRPIWEEDQP